MNEWGFLQGQKYLIFDRDTKFCISLRELIRNSGIQLIPPLPISYNLNAYAERFVKTIKEECLSQLILFEEKSLKRTLRAFLKHYYEERNYQGKGNRFLFPTEQSAQLNGSIRCRENFGGLVIFSHRQAT
jgi:putative transposase